jgi:hypothetical protein
MRRHRTRILSIGAAAAAVAFSASGCGAEDRPDAQPAQAAGDPRSSRDPVAQAVDVTARQQGGIRFAMTATVDAAGGRVPLTAAGTIDRGGRRGTFTTVIGTGAQKETIDEIIAGDVIYVRSGELTSSLPDGKTWARLDLDQRSGRQGVDLTALRAGGSQDPEQFLDYLRGAGTASRLGTEDVRGTRTTRYTVLVDPQKALARAASPEARAALRKDFSALRSRTIPMDVYVDDHDLVRREHMGFAVTQRGHPVSMEITVDFTGFGVPVRADPPADRDTFDPNAAAG